mgnify:CR=1 FL=1
MPLNIKHKKIIINSIKRSNPRTVILQLLNKALKNKKHTLKTEEILKFISHKYYNKNHFGSFSHHDNIPNWLPPWARNIACWFIPVPDLEKGEAKARINPLSSIRIETNRQPNDELVDVITPLPITKGGPLRKNFLSRSQIEERKLDKRLLEKLIIFNMDMKKKNKAITEDHQENQGLIFLSDSEESLEEF